MGFVQVDVLLEEMEEEEGFGITEANLVFIIVDLYMYL